MLVGARDAATRTIRADVRARAARRPARFGARGLAAERHPTRSCCATRASAPTTPGRARSIARSARRSQRQRAANRYRSVVGSWTRTWSPSAAQRDVRVLQQLPQRDRARGAGPAAHVSQPAGRRPRSACRREPTQKRFQLSDTADAGDRGTTRFGRAASGSGSTRASISTCSGRGASSSSRTSPASITTATAASTMTICCSR